MAKRPRAGRNAAGANIVLALYIRVEASSCGLGVNEKVMGRMERWITTGAFIDRSR